MFILLNYRPNTSKTVDGAISLHNDFYFWYFTRCHDEGINCNGVWSHSRFTSINHREQFCVRMDILFRTISDDCLLLSISGSEINFKASALREIKEYWSSVDKSLDIQVWCASLLAMFLYFIYFIKGFFFQLTLAQRETIILKLRLNKTMYASTHIEDI